MVRGSSGIGGAPMRLFAREADDEPARYRTRLDSRRTREAVLRVPTSPSRSVETMGADDRQAPAQPAGGSCIR
uniref:hypothetical protein n=1 Tax=Burkholderia multivorans TaxID=87883 RepID=UPI002157BAEC|nr:hypothetical protein [Burkholderia multivorans]